MCSPKMKFSRRTRAEGSLVALFVLSFASQISCHAASGGTGPSSSAPAAGELRAPARGPPWAASEPPSGQSAWNFHQFESAQREALKPEEGPPAKPEENPPAGREASDEPPPPSHRKLSTRSLVERQLAQSQKAAPQQQQQQVNQQASGPNTQNETKGAATPPGLGPPSSGCPPSGSAPGQAQADDWSAASSPGSFSFAQQRGTSGFTQARASEFVKPNFYTLRLKLDPQKRKFNGQLMVSVDLSQPSSSSSSVSASTSTSSTTNQTKREANPTSVRYLSLHAGANISVKKAFYVFSARNIQIPATRLGRNLTSELLTLDFHPNSIPLPSQGLLLLVYSGQVNDTESHGLFLHKSAVAPSAASSVAANSKSQVAQETPVDLAGLATHMEPSFARRLFPAWDEPHLKARFSLIVVLPFRGYETISNMPVKRKSISLSCSGEPLQEVEFHTTPTMSTYLLTLVVGKFEHIESITPNNCKVRAYFYSNQTAAAPSPVAPPAGGGGGGEQLEAHPPGANVNQRRRAAQMALDFAVRTFDYLESSLGVRYPLAKFDMIALREFNSGGMENWGASIFHENYLLCDNHNQNVNIRVNGGSNRPKRLVVPLVVAHEIAHQWFGNLITSRTWTYLWLNEGFAQLLMYEVAQALMPQEPYWNIFLEDNRKSAMAEDELITSARALELDESGDPLDQEAQMSLFDSLTYNKGALVLRMVQFALGPREFLAGLRHYLLKHSYDSVGSHDLWLALEESATGRGLEVGQLESIMTSWLKLEGFPVLRVRLSESPSEPHHYKLDFAQQRFTLLPAEASSWPGQVNATGGGGSAAATQEEGAWASSVWSIPVAVASELQPEPSEADLRLWAQTERGGSGPTSAAPLLQRRSATSAPGSGSSLLFGERAGSLMLPKASLGQWLKLNHRAIGYFRVDYQGPGEQQVELEAAPATDWQQVDLLARMAPAVRDQSMSPVDRFNLVEDLFAMVLAGRRSLVSYLRFLQDAYEQEQESLVLRFIFDSLERVRSALVLNSARASVATAGQPPSLVERAFERFVQNFVRKLIGAFRGRAPKQSQPDGDVDRPMSHQARALATRARRRTTSATMTSDGNAHAPNATSSAELLELFDSVRLAHNNEQLARWASDLFARHFRSSAPTKGPLESLGRELRAALYAAALNYHEPTGPAKQALGSTNEFRDYVTAQGGRVRSLEARWLQSKQAGQLQASKSNSTLAAGEDETVFFKLLAAYESGEASSGERAAIAAALGATRDICKQIFLLNLTLASQPTSSTVFRLYDASNLLESLARSLTGRQLVWLALNEQSELFKQRQLLSPALRSVSRGLIEPPVQQQRPNADRIQTQTRNDNQATKHQSPEVEGQLRQLYVIYGESEHGKLLGQSIEWVRINSLWFKRDHEQLAEFLASNSD